MRTGTAGAAQDRHTPVAVQQYGEIFEVALRRCDDRRRRQQGGRFRRRRIDCGLEGHVAGDHDHRHAALCHRLADRDFQRARHLAGAGHDLAVMAALAKQLLRVGFLKVAAADFMTGDLRGDGEDRHPAAVTVVEAVDQVQIAGTTAACADGQASGEMRVCARGEGRRLLVPHVHPPHTLLPANRIGDSVQGVAGYAVDPLDSLGDQSVDEEIRDRLGHGTSRSFFHDAKAPLSAVELAFVLIVVLASTVRGARRGRIRLTMASPLCQRDGP